MTVDTRPVLPGAVRPVRETRTETDGGVPLHPVPDWGERFPWLVHGTTGRGFDLGLFGDTPAGEVLGRWRVLLEALGLPAAVHSLQVHGAEVAVHETADEGVRVSFGRDGHVTAAPGLVLAVSLADCVPIFLVDGERRRVALLHGGWRGTAAGILGRGLEALGSDPTSLVAHLGPAICGQCYEVGPEVHTALGLDAPPGPEPIDLRALQARRLVEAGVPAAAITVSQHCTRCGEGFYSHRGEDAGRQMGLLGVR